jgi:hypothetical protein
MPETAQWSVRLMKDKNSKIFIVFIAFPSAGVTPPYILTHVCF